MTTGRVAVMSLVYGPIGGVIFALLLIHRSMVASAVATPRVLAAAIAWVTLAFFLLYRFTFAVAWNARARRLRGDDRRRA